MTKKLHAQEHYPPLTRVLQLKRFDMLVLAVFFLTALVLTSRAYASVHPSTKNDHHAEIALRTSGVYAEIFELAMDAYREHNYSAAVHLWQPIAESGYAPAQYNLGVVHARGLAVHKDMNIAGRWWQAAAGYRLRAAGV